jgi:peptide-methionine (S)-S-oxide reductase
MRWPGIVGAMMLTACVGGSAATEDPGVTIPAPAVDLPAGSRTSDIAVLAGGCFWGVQAVYQHAAGVTSAVSGYAGGREQDARYELVSAGRTRHAEAVRIVYDPRVITYGRLLQIFFSVAHNPTELNRQGPDHGPQYRSAIFPANEDQARVAKAYIGQLNDARVFPSTLATVLEPGRPFFLAEDHHQDFLERNRSNRYIVVNDLPKLEALKRLFPAAYRDKPVLVRGFIR